MIFEPVDGSGNRISNTDADKKKIVLENVSMAKTYVQGHLDGFVSLVVMESVRRWKRRLK